VQEALDDGTLAPERWASYLKLQRELNRVTLRRGSREHRELKRRWRARARETRRERRYGGKP
jgi:hypothetical protein